MTSLLCATCATTGGPTSPSSPAWPPPWPCCPGALLVGQSVRASLRDLLVQRLGATDVVVASDRFFREDLAGAFAAADRRRARRRAARSSPQGVLVREAGQPADARRSMSTASTSGSGGSTASRDPGPEAARRWSGRARRGTRCQAGRRRSCCGSRRPADSQGVALRAAREHGPDHAADLRRGPRRARTGRVRAAARPGSVSGGLRAAGSPAAGPGAAGARQHRCSSRRRRRPADPATRPRGAARAVRRCRTSGITIRPLPRGRGAGGRERAAPAGRRLARAALDAAASMPGSPRRVCSATWRTPSAPTAARSPTRSSPRPISAQGALNPACRGVGAGRRATPSRRTSPSGSTNGPARDLGRLAGRSRSRSTTTAGRTTAASSTETARFRLAGVVAIGGDVDAALAPDVPGHLGGAGHPRVGPAVSDGPRAASARPTRTTGSATGPRPRRS